MKFKRLISLFLTLLIVFGTLPIFSASVSAGVLGKIVGGVAKKGLEVGMRYAVQASMEAAARSETSTALPVVQSIVNHVLLDAQGVTINEISAMCHNILQQLSKIETELKEYTAEISSSIAKQNKNQIHQQFEEKWQTDVTDVLAKERTYGSHTGAGVNNAFDAYIKYLIVSTLYAKEASVGSVSEIVKEYWYTNFHRTLSADDYTLTAVNQAKENLELQFMRIFNKNSDLSAKDTVYKNAGVFHKLNDTLDELTNNFVYTGSGQKGFTVVDCAATDAFFGLSENADQYSYVMSAAKKQVFYATILQMCLNEYLSMQGEYLQSTSETGWADDVNLIANSDFSQRSYNDYKRIYSESIQTSLERATALMDANIKIDTSLHTGNTTPVEVTFDDYMKPEDATNVGLDIVGGATDVDYSAEVEKITDNTQSYRNATDSPDKISNSLSFRRVRMGLGDKVYYILNNTDTTLGSLAHRVKRYGAVGIDEMSGDLVVSSADFVNLRKNFSDGINTFSIPSNFETEYEDLLDTPEYTAVYEKNPGAYLAPYLPSNTTGTTYLLSKEYNNNLKLAGEWLTVEYLAPRTGWLKLGKLFGSVNESTIPIEQKDFEDIEDDEKNKYAVIAVPNGTYKQKATFRTVDVEGAIIDAYLVNGADEKKYNGESAVFEPSQDITIRFKLKDAGSVKHLKMIRCNESETETVYFGTDEFLNSFTPDEDGYYSFNISMPYSEIIIELEGTFAKSTEMDDEGHYVIRTYEDLKTVAGNIYNNNSEYANGHYVLANDIDCSGKDTWVYPIGRDEDTAFRGTFDGNGYTISNLNLNNPAEDLAYLGLFGVLDGATVKNLKLTKVSSYADAINLNFGHICGRMINQSLISNCYVQANVGAVDIRRANNIGGICGSVHNSVIEKTINEANVTFESAICAGGIVGEFVSGTIDNCGNREWVMAGARCDAIGGIAGATGGAENATISNSYTAGMVYAGANKSGDYSTAIISGGNNTPNMINNYHTGKTFTKDQILQMQMYDYTADFRSGEVTYTLNNNNPAGIWRQTIGTDIFPGFDGKAVTKTADNKYSNVYIVRFDANGGNGTMNPEYTADSYTLPSCGFTAPEGKAFKGWIVNGAEKAAGKVINISDDITISALWRIECTEHLDANDDGFCDVCAIANEPDIVDGYYQIGNYGELIWFAENVTTSHKVKLTGDITINPALAQWSEMDFSDINSAIFDGAGHTITFKNTSAGLFVSYNYSIIENLIFEGNILADTTNNIGVVVNDAFRTTIRNVTVKTDITNLSTGATGGIAGYFGGRNADEKYSLIENCAVYSNVVSGGIAGGIIGRIWDSTQYTTVKNSIYIGNVKGTTHTGAIVGYNGNVRGITSTISDSYYYCNDNSTEYVGGTNGGTLQVSNVLAVTNTQLASGEVAYKLGSAWGQRIYVDEYPQINGAKIYKYVDGYSNENKFGLLEIGTNNAIVNIPIAGTYTVIFADYEGGRLNNIASAAVDAQVAGEESVSVQIALGAGDKVMIWDSLTTANPMCKDITL